MRQIDKYAFEVREDGRRNVLTSEVDLSTYHGVTTNQQFDAERFNYVYFEAELNSLQVENYRPYVPFNDNKAIFDSGLSYVEFYSERYNSFEANFVETYCFQN